MTAIRTFASPYTVVLASIASAIVLTACGPEDGSPMKPPSPQVASPAAVDSAPARTPPRLVAQREVERERPSIVRHVGEVSQIEPITETTKPTGAGAVIGGVAGGVLGNQIGDGNGRKAATVLGVVGGAYAGNQVEKRRAEKIVGYRVSVNLDSGSVRTVRVAALDGLHIGERVRVDGNDLRRI